MDFAQGFTLLRELGRAGSEGYVSFEALVAIQMAHRLFAAVVTVAVLALAWRLWRASDAAARRTAALLVGLLVLQVMSGLSNVLLDWPLVAALAHSAGAAALVALLVSLTSRAGARALPVPSAVDPSLRRQHV
jgi:cytochrome c oxidase assembly protein subunit 15